MNKKLFSLKVRCKSFVYAFKGLKYLLATQHNAWIHLVATVAIIILGWHFSISRDDWVLLALAVAFVWSAEAFNTAIETLCDKVSPEENKTIGHCKDVAAVAVLFAAMAAIVVGWFVFWPHVISWLQ